MADVQTESNQRSPADSVGHLFARIGRSKRFESILLVSLLVWECCVLVLKSRTKLFWYDELLTFHISGLKPFSLLWKALLAGADGMPPGYYIIIRLARMIPGDPHVILRLPSVLGYILTLLGVYWFAQKRLPAPAGLAAVLLLAASPFRGYAVEARSYALLVGFLAIAAVCWQRIGERWFMTLLFAISLALAVSSHHLAVVAVSVFAAAELAWSIFSRRVRWSIWASCALAAGPFFIGLPILLRYRETFGKSFWSRPTWSMVQTTYKLYLGLDSSFNLALMALIAAVIGSVLSRSWRTRRMGLRDRDFSPPELVLVAAFTLYPALLVTLAKVLNSGYVDRYGWPAILGLDIGIVYVFRAIGIRSASRYLVAALLIPFAVIAKFEVTVLAKTTFATHDERWTRLAQLSRDNPDLPVMIGNGTTYLEAAEYAPPELRGRLVQAFDADIATRFGGVDTTERTNRVLAQFIPLRVEDLASFQGQNQRFIYYSRTDKEYFDWIKAYYLPEGYRLTLLSQDGPVSIFMVQR